MAQNLNPVDRVQDTQNIEVITVTEKNKLPSGLKIFIQALKIYKENFKILAKVFMLPVIISIMIITFVGIISSILNEAGTVPTLTAIFVALLFFIGFIYFGSWLGATLYQTVHSILEDNEKITFTQAYTKSKDKIWIFLGVNILSVLAIFGGTLLLIVPGIIFSVWFSLSGYLVFSENLSGVKALSASRAYIKGKFWAVVLRWGFLGIIYLLIAVVVSSLLTFIFSLSFDTSITLTRLILGVFWFPLMMIFGYLIYFYIKYPKNIKIEEVIEAKPLL